MPILMDQKRRDRQPMPLLKRGDITTETVRALSTASAVCEAGEREKPDQGVRIGPSLKFAKENPRDPPMDLHLFRELGPQ